MSNSMPSVLDAIVMRAISAAESILGRLDRTDDHPAAAALKEKAVGIASDGEATEKQLSELEAMTDQLRQEDSTETVLKVEYSVLRSAWKDFCALIDGRNVLPLAPSTREFARKHGLTRRRAKALINVLIRAGMIVRKQGRLKLRHPDQNGFSIHISIFD